MSDPTTMIVGNLVRDPDLRFTPTGAAVVNFTVAHTPRVLDRQTNQWRDGTPLFMGCTAWRDLAENVAESFRKGQRVMVVGTLAQQNWDDGKTGEKRSRIVLEAEEVGGSAKFATVQVTPNPRKGGGPAGAAAGGDGGWSPGAPTGQSGW